jgi:integrase
MTIRVVKTYEGQDMKAIQAYQQPTISSSIKQSSDQNPAAVYIASLTSAHSRRNMKRYLHQIAQLLTDNRFDADTLDWSAVRYQHSAAVRAQLSGLYAPATINGVLSALRGVLKASWKLGQMTAEDYQRAIDVQNVSGSTLPAGRDLSQGEILALSNTCISDPTPAGARDAAIIAVLYTCALRRAELVSVKVSDFEPANGKLTIRSGKGRKDRTVYASNGTLAALDDWLAIRGDEPGALFCPVNKAGKVTVRHMTSQAVYNMLKKRAVEAAVNNFSPHDFRRTFVGDMLDRGVDIVTVQKLAGHASVTTTGRYDRRPEEAKRAAAAKLHFPYQKRKGA